jgi:hypothetical protein
MHAETLKVERTPVEREKACRLWSASRANGGPRRPAGGGSTAAMAVPSRNHVQSSGSIVPARANPSCAEVPLQDYLYQVLDPGLLPGGRSIWIIDMKGECLSASCSAIVCRGLSSCVGSMSSPVCSQTDTLVASQPAQ